jgi:hypothetical protein
MDLAPCRTYDLTLGTDPHSPPRRKVLIDARKQVLIANREKENAEYEAKRAGGGSEH